jgi:hypothetical protein
VKRCDIPSIKHMNKSDILKQQRLHRGDARSFVLNFLLNFASYARLMRTFLPAKTGKEDIFRAAMRAYVIGMASCLETYFRDLYLHLIQRDPVALQRALQANGRRESLSTIARYIADGLTEEEIASVQVSFQNAESIDRNFSAFVGQSFFDVLDQFEVLCAIPSVNKPGLANLRLFPGWQDQLARIFLLRHEFAHDANSKTSISPEEMRSLETTAILVCQVSALLPAISPKSASDQNSVPVILLIVDLVSEDWEVVSEERLSPTVEA